VAAIRRGWLDPGTSGTRFLDALVKEVEASPSYSTHAGRSWMRQLHDPARPWVGDIAFVGEPLDVAEALATWCRSARVDYVVFKMNWGVRDFPALREQLVRAREMLQAVNS
jgi:hypothetical protein